MSLFFRVDTNTTTVKKGKCPAGDISRVENRAGGPQTDPIGLAEDSNQVAAASGAVYDGGAPGGYPAGVPPPPPEADSNLDSSERESIGEAVGDVRDAQSAYDEGLASGSSSDIEEARENLADAHEDYQEGVQEAYED